MAKMSFKNYKSTEVVKVPDSQVEVIPAGQADVFSTPANHEIRKTSPAGELGQSLANAASPVAAFCDCIKDTVEVVNKCIVAVSIAKEKTIQEKVKYNAQIIESKEQTSRIKIEEKEKTKRLEISCENNLSLRKIELEKLCAELSSKEKDAMNSHKERMACLEVVQRSIEEIRKSKMEVIRFLQGDCLDKDEVERLLHKLHLADEQLSKITLRLL